jgi:pimeloyl-ACP methyl ester carboxylesterase
MLLEALIALGTFANYEVASTTRSHPHPSIERVEYAIEVGESALDRFSIVHVGGRHGRAAPRGAVILLSPFSLPGAFYEISETGSYVQSMAGRLASRGIDVWLVDQRRSGLPPGTCEAGLADCSPMAAWDFDAYSTDALYALWLSKSIDPDAPVVLGGFSAGSNAALATVNRAPEAFAGVWLYEGTFHTVDPALKAHNDPICSLLQDALAGGTVFEPSLGILRLVLELASADPDGPSPLPFFPPGTSNQLAMLLVFGAPPPPGAIAPTPGFIRNIADFDSLTFVHTRQSRLELVGPLFDSYGSIAALRDLACGLAGHDTKYVDNLGAFDGSVLISVQGTGFGSAMFDTAALFTGAASVQIDENPELGEADAYFHREWETVLFEPVHRWMTRTLRGN